MMMVIMMMMMMMMMMMINITFGYTCETTGIKRADQRAINAESPMLHCMFGTCVRFNY